MATALIATPETAEIENLTDGKWYSIQNNSQREVYVHDGSATKPTTGFFTIYPRSVMEVQKKLALKVWIRTATGRSNIALGEAE